MLLPSSLCAQTILPVVTMDVGLTASDNGALSAAGNEKSEFISSIRPRVVLGRRGAGFEFDLDAAATVLTFANGTQDNDVLPDVRARLKAAVVERLLYIGAAAHVRQSEIDPFGSRSGDTTGANRRTESTYELSPAIERELTPHSSLLARHDVALTTNGAGEGSRLTSQRSLIRLERAPVPLGAAVEVSRLENELEDFGESRFTLETARLRGSVQVDDQLILGLVVGKDRSEFLLSEHTDSLYGASVQWRPGPRTELSATLERRFFGNAGALGLRHRLPFMSFALTMKRQPVTASSSLGTLGQGSDLRGFLDAILTTRYPDPTVRDGLVDTLVTNRNLDTRLRNAIDVVAEYPQLETGVDVTWVLLGTRNTASVTFYSRTARVLTREGDPLSSLIGAAADDRQRGGFLQFTRRLTPQLSAGLSAQWSKIEGLAEREGDVSDEKVYRLSLTKNVSPRTAYSAGVQRNRFDSTVNGVRSYDATLLSVGVSHRF
jgi:uncharacterized protein (PEP-CTERM system associated)